MHPIIIAMIRINLGHQRRGHHGAEQNLVNMTFYPRGGPVIQRFNISIQPSPKTFNS